MTSMFSLPYYTPIPPPPFPWMSRLELARWQQRWYPRNLTVDDIWLLRDAEVDTRNNRRARDWETRFKILGPREID